MPQNQGFRGLQALIENQRQARAEKQASEDKKVEDQRAAELHKLLTEGMNLENEKTSAQLALDKVKAKEIFADIKRGDIEQAEKKIKQARQDEQGAALGQFAARPPTVGLHQEEGGQTVIGDFEDIHQTRAEVEQIPFNQQQQIEQLEAQSRATSAGSIRIAEINAESREIIEELGNLQMDKNNAAKRQTALAVAKARENLRIANRTDRLRERFQTPASIEFLNESIEDIRLLKKDFSKTTFPDVGTFNTIASLLAEEGITPFGDFKEHANYERSKGNIIGILEDQKKLLAARHNISKSELEVRLEQVRENPEFLADPGSFARITAGLSGFFQEATGSSRASVIQGELGAKYATLSQQLGGDTGARLSDLDLKLAAKNVPGVGFTFSDNIAKVIRVEQLFERKFNNLYSSVNDEVREELIERMRLPFKASLELSERRSRVTVRQSSTLTAQQEDTIQQIANETGKSVEEIRAEVTEQLKRRQENATR